MAVVNQSSPAPLSPAQIEAFHREGYLVVDGVFTETDLQPVIDEIDDEVGLRAKQAMAEGVLSRDYHEEPFDKRLTRISAETDRVAMSIWNGILHGPAVFNLIRNPSL